MLRPASWRMLRNATAMIVFVGLCAPEVTNTDPSNTIMAVALRNVRHLAGRNSAT